MKIKLSRSQWELVGRKTGWMKTSALFSTEEGTPTSDPGSAYTKPIDSKQPDMPNHHSTFDASQFSRLNSAEAIIQYLIRMDKDYVLSDPLSRANLKSNLVLKLKTPMIRERFLGNYWKVSNDPKWTEFISDVKRDLSSTKII